MNIWTLISSGVRLALPLLLGAYAIFVSSKAGIVNMGMEGNMLAGCFFSVWISYLTGNAWIGMLGGMAAGMIFSLLLGILIIKSRGNHVVCGIGFNFISIGMTTVFLSTMFGVNGNSPEVASLPRFELPLVGRQSPILFLAIIACVLVSLLLFKTNFGLRLRSIGENPSTADVVGIPIVKYQFIAMAITGILGGLAGTEMALGQLSYFAKEMTAGKGYIAYVAVIFGAYKPAGIVLATIFLGVLDAFQMRAQTVYNLPGQFFIILPYLLTIVILPLVRHTKQPAAEGMTFIREK